jgi:hypothetical protein
MMRTRRFVVAVAVVLVALACALTAIAMSGGRVQPPPRYRWSQATYAPKPGSVRIEARADDPGGDAPWVVRVWITRDNQQACEQLGREVGGVIGDTGVDGRFRPLKFGERTRCSPRVLDQDEPIVQVATFLDDPLADKPKPLRTVAWGIAGPRATKVTVDGPGGRRRAPATPWRAWLDVRAGTTPTYELVTRVHYASRPAVTIDYGRARRASRHPVPGSVTVDSRAKTRDGGPEHGLLVWRTANRSTCSTEGSLLGDDRVGSWSDDGTFFDYPIGEGASCVSPDNLSRELPFALSASSGYKQRDTAITGIASPDVAKVIVEGTGVRREVAPGTQGGVLAFIPNNAGRVRTTVVFKDGSTKALQTLRIGAPNMRMARYPRISAIAPKVVPVTPRGSFTLLVSCSDEPRRPKCMNSLYLYSVKAFKRPSGLSYHVNASLRLVRLGRGTKDRPLRFRLSRVALRLLEREHVLDVIVADTGGGRRRREFRVRLVEEGHAARAARVSSSPAVIVRPAKPRIDSRIVVAWRVPEPMDNNGDGYRIRFTGPGGDDCSSTKKYGGGVTWNVRYNHRYERGRAKVAFGPNRATEPPPPGLPTDSTWCRGHYSGAVDFVDYPAGLRHGKNHTSRSCTRAQVRSGRCQPENRLVGRFEFDVRQQPAG